MTGRQCRGLIAAIVVGVGAILSGVAGATSISVPAGVPHVDANAPLQVTATGFPPGANVFVEQCDGVPPTEQGWDPTVNCDLGSSPPAAIADAQGSATFPAGDVNRAFHPFQGESPQSLFNCMPAATRAPENGLASFTDCKIRVSTNNSAVTADQVFLPIVLTGRVVPVPTRPGAAPASSPTTGSPSRSTSTSVPSGTAKARSAATGPGAKAPGSGTTDPRRRPAHRAGTGAATPAATSVTTAVPAHTNSGAGLAALSDAGVRTGYILLAVGLVIALVPLLARRRRPRAPSPVDEMTPTRPSGEGT